MVPLVRPEVPGHSKGEQSSLLGERPKRYIVIVSRRPLRVCGLLLVVAVSATAAGRGWLRGSVAFFDYTGFVDSAKKSRLVIACNGQKVLVQADLSGDFDIQLGRCEYQLVEVLGPSGEALTISPRQPRTFTISDGARTRFDVMIKPATPPTPSKLGTGAFHLNEPTAQMTSRESGLSSPSVSWAQISRGPTGKVVFSVDGTMELPAFKATCDRPCKNILSEATANYEAVPLFFDNEPNSVGLTLRSPRPFPAGIRVLWIIRSLDDRPITITGFRSLEIGEVPAELRH